MSCSSPFQAPSCNPQAETASFVSVCYSFRTSKSQRPCDARKQEFISSLTTLRRHHRLCSVKDEDKVWRTACCVAGYSVWNRGRSQSILQRVKHWRRRYEVTERQGNYGLEKGAIAPLQYGAWGYVPYKFLDLNLENQRVFRTL